MKTALILMYSGSAVLVAAFIPWAVLTAYRVISGVDNVALALPILFLAMAFGVLMSVISSIVYFAMLFTSEGVLN